MLTDLRHLWRNLGRSRASATAAALTLALTLGAGTSIFAVVDAVLLTPPPFARPHELYTVREVPLDGRAAPQTVPYATFDAWRKRADSFAGLEAFDGTNLTLTGIGPAARVQVTDATPGLLALLGVSPARGRTFTADDVGQSVAIVSHHFWRTTLAADPGIVGRDIVLGGRPYTVLGVLPESFVFALGVADIWRPLAMPSAATDRAAVRVSVIARLTGDATASDMAEALSRVSQMSTPGVRVVPTQVATAIAGDRTATLTLLAGAAGLAILLTFVNLAGLLVVRAIDRRRELAVRTALGAGPADVAWQVVLESGAIVAAGTLGGLWLGWWGAPVVANLIVERVAGQPEMSVALSGRITGGLVLLSGLCAVVCSVWPAMYATRWNLVTMLRHAATPSPRERLLRRAFVVGEVALACVLVASTSLIGRALVALLDVTPGFDARGVLALQVSLPRASYPDGLRASAFYATLQSALTERLGPREVAVVDELPLTGLGRRRLLSARPGEAQREVVVRAASLAYFEVMRIPVVAGRTFDATDSALATVRRVVVSASLAEQLFGSAPAVGRTVWLLPEAVTAEVIGVVGDVLHRALDDVASPTLYESFLQEPSRSSVLVVQSRRPPADVTAIVREEAGKLDAALPVYRVRSLEDVVSASPGLPARRLLTAALTAFGVLALLLSAVGLFGVVAHDVASRRTELGLRLALGASPTRLLLRTVGQGLMLVAAGLGVGSVLTAWALNALGAAIHSGEGRADVFNVGVAAAVLITVGVISVLPPARRAAKTNPLAVLRGE